MEAADSSTAGCDLVLTLVHGTWPRGPLRDVFLTPFYGVWPKDYGKKQLWFSEGSEFRNRLTAAFGRRGGSPSKYPRFFGQAQTPSGNETKLRRS